MVMGGLYHKVHGLRLAQGSEMQLDLKVDRPHGKGKLPVIHMQLDGEPWQQELPCQEAEPPLHVSLGHLWRETTPASCAMSAVITSVCAASLLRHVATQHLHRYSSLSCPLGWRAECLSVVRLVLSEQRCLPDATVQEGVSVQAAVRNPHACPWRCVCQIICVCTNQYGWCVVQLQQICSKFAAPSEMASNTLHGQHTCMPCALAGHARLSSGQCACKMLLCSQVCCSHPARKSTVPAGPHFRSAGAASHLPM